MKIINLILALSILTTTLWSQNHCLDFDGVDDFINASVTLGNANFTTEVWFKSDNSNTNTVCPNNFKRLISLGGPASRLEVGECGGELNIFWLNPLGANPTFPMPSAPNIGNDGLWHHLAMVRNGNDVEVFLDCISVFQNDPVANPIGNMNFDLFRIGRWPGGGTTPNQWWLGQVDDVRLWNRSLTLTEIDNQKNCVLSGSEPGLQIYWPLDQGIAAGNNTTITQAVDVSPSNNSGNLLNFDLGDPSAPSASQSNFIASNAGLIYPNYNGLDFEIRDYPYRNNLLTEICNGEPAHFCLFDNGQAPAPNSNITVQWEYSDDGGTSWNNITGTPFVDFCFGVPSGNITMDCSTSITGFVDRKYRAISNVTQAPFGSCDYFSDEYDIRICCPINPATAVIISPPNPLCEGDAATLNVSLDPSTIDLFVQTPGPNVTIDWCLNGSPIVPALPPNTTSFTYNFTAPVVLTPTNFCFEAKITNCANKSSIFSSCIRVDPEPKCGRIIGLPTPSTLTQVFPSPNPVYEMCPDNDASLGIDPAFPFSNCNPQWQYSFDQLTWFPLGFSNSIQNTNILPRSVLNWPPGATSIFYRIQCLPLVNPSACDPCFGDTLEIQLIDDPQPATITGINQICKGDISTLSVSNPDPSHTYTWFCNGLQVGTGTNYQASMDACYWVEISNGCVIAESPQYCLTVCEVIPKLSCPITPNECACLGDPITLDACDSEYSCDPAATLIYAWYINGVLQTTTTCDITDTPPAAGSTYRVEVTHPASGCTASTERFVKPCDKQ